MEDMGNDAAVSGAPPTTTDAVLAELDRAWAELEDTINRLDAAALTGPTDAAGWTAKDHLAHLAAWERSLIALLAGEDRAAALGVDPALYARGDIDVINAALRTQHAVRPLAEVLGDLRETHERTRATVAALSAGDLALPYAHYQPRERPDETAAVVHWVAGDTYEHYREHRGWIMAIVARQPTADGARAAR